MRGSRGRLSSSVFLSGVFLAVWAAGAVAQVPFEGGTWSFSWVERSKSCGTSISFQGGRRTVTTGCFPDMTPSREKATLEFRPGKLPALSPIWPCGLEQEQRAQLYRYVASRTTPRRFTMKVPDRAKAIAVFETSCSLPEYPWSRLRLNRWSSVVTVSADGQRIRQRAILWYSFDIGPDPVVRQRLRVTASVRGRRTGDTATTTAVGEDTAVLRTDAAGVSGFLHHGRGLGAFALPD